MHGNYSISDNNISGIRFLDGKLQTRHSTVQYEDGKAVCGGIEWVDVPMITSDNLIP